VLASAVPTSHFNGKSFDQQAMVDATCDKVSDISVSLYYPLSWQVLSIMTLNGDMTKVSTLLQSAALQHANVSGGSISSAKLVMSALAGALALCGGVFVMM
jgi:hypothetical protein